MAVAAVSAKLRAILLKKFAKFYNFSAALLILHITTNSVHTESQNSDIPIHSHLISNGFFKVHVESLFRIRASQTQNRWPQTFRRSNQ